MTEEQLAGGITNPGAVGRDGPHLLRPSTPYTDSVHAFLLHVTDAGFRGAPKPIGVDPDGRERLEFVEGDVPLSPYPQWCQTDSALASIVRLMRGLHHAASSFDPEGLIWPGTLADPTGGTTVCHNDVELSNIVFRGGIAVALIDFEFAAPGRPIYDLAQMARLCMPIEHEFDQERMGWIADNHPGRLRLVADEYGLDAHGRAALLDAIELAMNRSEELTRQRFVECGEQAVREIERMGGLVKFDRRREWSSRHHDLFVAALA